MKNALTFLEEDLYECSVYIPVEIKNLLSFIYSLTFDFKSSMHTNVASFFHHVSGLYKFTVAACR